MARLLAFTALLLTLSGCANPAAPDMLVVDAGNYAAAFSGTIDVLREEGLRPTVRDPRSGVIEAGPVVASSMLEPWRGDHSSFDSALESTIHHQRRRVRVEFQPLNTAVSSPSDYTEATGPLALHVHAWLERAYEPGRRRNLWSRRLSVDTVVYAPGETETPVERRFWLPVRRDAEYESHLRARLVDLVDRAD